MNPLPPTPPTTHDILEATAFVALMSVDMLRGNRRDKRCTYARKLFVATAMAEGKTRSMITRALRRDRTTVRYHQHWIAALEGEKRATLEVDVSRVQMELRRRRRLVCPQRSSQLNQPNSQPNKETSHDL